MLEQIRNFKELKNTDPLNLVFLTSSFGGELIGC